MIIRFAKMNPARNMTILVESPVPRKRQQQTARELMAYDSIHAEQVGFIEKAGNPAAWARLQMMGGEFCGNALMSLAALLALDRGLPPKISSLIPLESSGVEGLVKIKVVPASSGVKCSLELPPPKKVSRALLKAGGHSLNTTVVDMQGITHFVLPAEEAKNWAETQAEELLNLWAEDCPSDAAGLLLFNREDCSIKPLVLVKTIGSLVWEKGCGSGTAALGAMLADEAKKSIKAKVSQPGGVITVKAGYADGRVKGLVISSLVRMSARGLAYL